MEMLKENKNSHLKTVYNHNSDAQMIIILNQRLINYFISLKDIWQQQEIILEINLPNLKHLLSLMLFHKINTITMVFGTRFKDIQEV